MELVAHDGWTESCRDEAVYLAGAGMSFESHFREEQFAIERHLETAAAAGQQHRTGDPRRPRVEEFSHQTGGSIRVVSDDAELDLEFVRLVGRLVLHGHTIRPRGLPAPRTRTVRALVVPCFERYACRSSGQVPMT